MKPSLTVLEALARGLERELAAADDSNRHEAVQAQRWLENELGPATRRDLERRRRIYKDAARGLMNEAEHAARWVRWVVSPAVGEALLGYKGHMSGLALDGVLVWVIGELSALERITLVTRDARGEQLAYTWLGVRLTVPEPTGEG